VSHLIRIGTRGSKLALTQSRWVQARLQEARSDIAAELVTITTSGDRFLDQPLSAIGGKGLFVKEIEEALSARAIDCAVHSMKDVPDELAPGLVVAAVPAREDPRDLLIARGGNGLRALPNGARLGTSSLRRMALCRAARRDLDVIPLRGNVDTRLRKLDAGEVDAIVLAAAGLRRLGITRADAAFLDPEDFVPAIGQGALAIETRNDSTAAILAALDDPSTRVAVTAERAFLHRVGGSCRTPLAAHATIHGESMTLRALIASPDGSRVVRGERTGRPAQGAAMGVDLADDLLARGGAAILQALGVN
jgi:hydroxymethylbilane synthase